MLLGDPLNNFNQEKHFSLSNKIIFFFILVSGFALRVWGISFGLPDIFHPDEQKIVSGALGFGTGDLNPHFFRYPTFYFYIQFLIYGSYFVIGSLFGLFSSSFDFAYQFYNDPTNIYLIGRLGTASFGTATIAVVYFIGRRFFNAATGLMAAAFTAFSFLLIQDSHFITTDIPATFLIMICAYFSMVYIDGGNKRHIFYAGLFCGLAASTKYNGGLALIILLAAIFVKSKSITGKGKAKTTALLFASVSILALIGFIAGSPFIILDFKTFLKDIFFEINHTQTGHFGFSQNQSGFWFHIETSLANGTGWALTILGCFSLLFWLFKPKEKGWILTLFPLIYFLVIGCSSTMFQRYAIPIVPFMSLFAGYSLTTIGKKITKKRRRRAAFLFFISFLLIAPNIPRAFFHNYLLTKTDTRTLAKQWIENRIPPDTVIATDPYGPKIFAINSGSLGTEKASALKEKIKRKLLETKAGYRVINLPYNHKEFATWYNTFKPKFIIVSSYMTDRMDTSKGGLSAPSKFLEELKCASILSKTISPYRGREEYDSDNFDMKCIYSPCAEDIFYRSRPGPVITVYQMPYSD